VAPLASADGPASAAAGSAPAVTLRNPADEEPAVAPGPAAAAAPAAGTVSAQPLTPADYASLPTLSSLGDSVPALQLNLLVSSTRPAARYALINMRRVHEGDVLPEGARVLAITRDGVAMEYRGQDFLLRPPAAPPAQ
jgi:general secretion pathway protein B